MTVAPAEDTENVASTSQFLPEFNQKDGWLALLNRLNLWSLPAYELSKHASS